MKATRNSHAFTLIEMLVVIAIIGVLAGMLFKLMQNANRARERAVCTSIIEKVAFALNEFKAEYGQYPPGDSSRWDESANWWPGAMPELLKKEYFGEQNGQDKLYNYSYLSYLLPRHDDPAFAKNTQLIEDTDRDRAAKQRWANFLEGLVSGGTVTNFYSGRMERHYALNYETICDPWGQSLVYRCTPPYQIYDLYSKGPDGASGTPDDMHKAQKWDD